MNDQPTLPPTLAQQLESLMIKTRDDHGELVRMIGLLGLELFERDSEAMRALEAVLDGQARRASEMAGVVQTIAARISYVPPIETVALYAAGDPRAGALSYAPGAGGVH